MIRTQPIAEHIIAAPTGPLIVPATGAGAAQPVLSLVVTMNAGPACDAAVNCEWYAARTNVVSPSP